MQRIIFGGKRCLALAGFASLVGCGETVNYETREKLLISAVAGSGDAVNADPSGAGDARRDGDPHALCMGREKLVQSAHLNFPELPAGSTCDFGRGEMLSRKDGYIRAYLSQQQTITLPEGAILCGFELTHREQDMRYDDEMFFLLNQQILIATKDYSEYFPQEGVFHRFVWEKLRDQVYDQFDDRALYCVGGEEGFSSCRLPPTDTRGSIELALTPDMSEKLAATLGRERRLDFSWVTTGDNDSSDCRHTPIDFDIKLQYVLE